MTAIAPSSVRTLPIDIENPNIVSSENAKHLSLSSCTFNKVWKGGGIASLLLGGAAIGLYFGLRKNASDNKLQAIQSKPLSIPNFKDQPIFNQFILEINSENFPTDPKAWIRQIEQSTKSLVAHAQPMANNFVVVTFQGNRTHIQAEQFAEKLRNLPIIESVDIDAPIFKNQAANDPKLTEQQYLDLIASYGESAPDFGDVVLPNDPLARFQWDMYGEAGGIRLDKAHEITLGEGSKLSAIDTGLTSGTDIISELKERITDTEKWDFLRWPFDADSDFGYDTNPGMTKCHVDGRIPLFSHGEHVAGTIAATQNNGEGITGVAPMAQYVPMRALNDCDVANFGLLYFASDLTRSIRWLSALPVTLDWGRVIENKNPPVDAINMSLGGPIPCFKSTQATINEALEKNVVLVVSAGNENTNYKNSMPANCKGVIPVIATDYEGKRSSYSNFGEGAIAAPGGDPKEKDLSIIKDYVLSTNGDSKYLGLVGTSMAAPHVVGVIGLMRSLKPDLSPTEVKDILYTTARAVSHECDKGENQCGIGILNAQAAVEKVLDLIN